MVGAMTTRISHWIDGRPQAGTSGRSAPVHNPATGVVTTFLTPSNPGPEGIAASPDGTVWFTQSTKGNVARIDNAGVITEGKVVKSSDPFQITVAPNGDPWYTMMAANKIGTVPLG